MKKSTKRLMQVAALLLACFSFLGVYSCDKSKSAAVAINKYAEALSHFQDAEIVAHNRGKVSDAVHHQILLAEKAAAKTGSDLNQATLIANSGGDPTQYVDAANKAFNDLVAAIKSDDPQTQQELTTAANLAGMALKNAISLIRTVKSGPAPTGSAVFSLLFLVVGATLAGATVTLKRVLDLLSVASELEPIAYDLVLKLAQSLKGKTVEEVAALNDAIFKKVEAVADAELAREGGSVAPQG